ncbi:Hypothetical predicted protein [Mytilus galloprovincialis]|uniref:Uncharacterized protein n=1 Tax=Mytilus galloprovincialis TaxID=29158 RepID=A0A8B6CY46_MYTGA|nr:Hypothetical predicted protein [Mytilus galloprovincialis]
MSLFEMKLLRSIILLITFIAVIDKTKGACCGKPFKYYCGDCTVSLFCCGHNQCNIFCYGCTCRGSPEGKFCRERGPLGKGCYCEKVKRKRHVQYVSTDMSAHMKFMNLDINKNEMMEQFEFSKALEQMKKRTT